MNDERKGLVNNHQPTLVISIFRAFVIILLCFVFYLLMSACHDIVSATAGACLRRSAVNNSQSATLMGFGN